MTEEKPMTLGYFREYTKNLPDNMPINLHDSNLMEPIPIIGIHQKILVADNNYDDEELSIILECLEVEIVDGDAGNE